MAYSSRLAKSVLQGALHAGIQSVQAVQRQRLGGAEAPPREGVGAVVGQDAVGESVQLRLGEALEPPRALGDELLPERHVAHQRAGLAEGDLRAELELERLADVVQDRGASGAGRS